MDTPQLELSTITSAFRALDDRDVCLGPSEDGGYYLLGLRELEPALFEDIAWSTSSVLSTTLERARERDLTVARFWMKPPPPYVEMRPQYSTPSSSSAVWYTQLQRFQRWYFECESFN